MKDIHAALENWARWVRGRDLQGHCASIEYRFAFKKRPDDTLTGWGDWHWSDKDRIAFQAPVDARQALAVERVMRYIPEGHRSALVLFYVGRLPYRGCCRILHLGYDMWPRFLSDAQAMVANRLQTPENARICTPTIRLPAFAA